MTSRYYSPPHPPAIPPFLRNERVVVFFFFSSKCRVSIQWCRTCCLHFARVASFFFFFLNFTFFFLSCRLMIQLLECLHSCVCQKNTFFWPASSHDSPCCHVDAVTGVICVVFLVCGCAYRVVPCSFFKFYFGLLFSFVVDSPSSMLTFPS